MMCDAKTRGAQPLWARCRAAPQSALSGQPPLGLSPQRVWVEVAAPQGGP